MLSYTFSLELMSEVLCIFIQNLYMNYFSGANFSELVGPNKTDHWNIS